MTAVAIGPDYPTTATDSGASIVWTNPNNVFADDSTNATMTPSTTAANNSYIDITGLGFGASTGDTITGIVVEVNGFRSGGTTGNIRSDTVQIIKAGVAGGTNKGSATNWGTATSSVLTYGSASDLWGNTLAPADVNASNFGVRLRVANNGASADRVANVDYIRVTVYVSGGTTDTTQLDFTTTVTQDAGGTFTSGNSWTNPDNARLNDSTAATLAPVSTTGNKKSNMLIFTLADAGLPSGITAANLAGFQVKVKWKTLLASASSSLGLYLTDGASSVFALVSAYISSGSTSNGSSGGSQYAGSGFAVPGAANTYGTTTWGSSSTTLTSLNSSWTSTAPTFLGVEYCFTGSVGTETPSIDQVTIEFWYPADPGKSSTVIKQSLTLLGVGI